MKIGYYQRNYPNVRNIINCVQGCTYQRVSDFSKLKRYFLLYLNKKIGTAFKTDFVSHEFYLPTNVDLFHFFNFISFGDKPWLTTFETTVPRGSFINQVRTNRCIEALKSPQCRKLIAISECTLNLQKKFLEKFPVDYEEIVKKLTCIHPPQKILVNSFEEKRISLQGPLKFVFVGSLFFRKGGKEILDVFCDLRNVMKLDVELTIVSNLSKDIDNVANETNEDIAKAKHIINSNVNWITYFEHLDNRSVLDLMKRSHIGLLPTYADTYGYSVLEFQASGCPVISTNVRALPEINNTNKGWLIEVPRHESGEAIYKTFQDKDAISKAIKLELKSIILSIIANRSVIIEKGKEAIAGIIRNHCPVDYSNKLKQIYLEALY